MQANERENWGTGGKPLVVGLEKPVQPTLPASRVMEPASAPGLLEQSHARLLVPAQLYSYSI